MKDRDVTPQTSLAPCPATRPLRRHKRKALVSLALVSIVVFGGATAQAQNGTPAGIVSWWPLDETSGTEAADVIDGNPGTHVGGPTPVPGVLAGGLSFDGIDDYVQIPNAANLNPGTVDFSLAFWMQTTSHPESFSGANILSKRPICNVASFWDIRLAGDSADGRIRVELREEGGANDTNYLSRVAVNFGQWRHIALVREGPTSSLYIDGQLDSSRPTDGPTNISNDADLLLGNGPCVGVDGTTFFEGELDEIQYFEVALTADQVQAICNAGSPGSCEPSTGPVIFEVTDGVMGSIQNLAPGGAINVRGSDLTNGDTCTQTENPPTTELCGAELLLNGELIGMVFASPSQLGAVLPVDASLGPGELIAELQDVPSEPFPLVIDPHAPVIRTTTATPNGPGFFRNTDRGGATVTSDDPADPGNGIVGFGTGFGLPDPMAMLSGAVDRDQEGPVVQVTVGCSTMDVISALAQAQNPGVDQFFFRVPNGLPGGNQGVQVDVNGFKSNRVTLPVSGDADVPFVCAGVNGANFAAGEPVAAGSIVSLFVVNIGDSQRLGLFPATEADGVSVTFDNTPAPLFDIVPSAGQMNVFAPTELPEMGNVEVKLTTSTGTSGAFMLEMTQAAPGIFLVQGTSFAAATLANTRWIPLPDATSQSIGLPIDCTANNVNPASFCGQPVRAGDILTLFLTGLGRATPNGDPSGEPLPTGTTAPFDTLYSTVMTPDVMIGDLPARVFFSGLAPGFAGLYQINVGIPDGVTPGDEVKVKVTMPNGAMDMANIAVRQ